MTNRIVATFLMKLLLCSFSIIFLLQISASPTQQPQQKPKASLEGVVTRAETGQPVPNARVTITSGSGAPQGPAGPGVAVAGGTLPQGQERPIQVAGRGTFVAPNPLPAVTDDSGRFVFQNLDEGGYS